jgi:hypothetical protein
MPVPFLAASASGWHAAAAACEMASGQIEKKALWLLKALSLRNR